MKQTGLREGRIAANRTLPHVANPQIVGLYRAFARAHGLPRGSLANPDPSIQRDIVIERQRDGVNTE